MVATAIARVRTARADVTEAAITLTALVTDEWRTGLVAVGRCAASVTGGGVIAEPISGGETGRYVGFIANIITTAVGICYAGCTEPDGIFG